MRWWKGVLGLLAARRVLTPGAQAREDADLLKAKFDAARLAYEAGAKAQPAGRSDAEHVYLWSRRWLEAQRDLSDKQADRVAAAAAHLDRMKELRKVTTERYKTGVALDADVAGTEFYVAEAELWLTQAKRK